MQDNMDAAMGVNSLKLCNPPQMLVAMNRASMDVSNHGNGSRARGNHGDGSPPSGAEYI